MQKKIVFIGVFVLGSLLSSAQPGTTRTKKLSVFIDCSSTDCDMDYIRSEINLVDFIRDPAAADVHVLITQQNTGGGGNKYELIFFGQHTYKKTLDTLRFDADANATEFEIRDLQMKYIQLGLASFIARTPEAGHAILIFKKGEVKKNTSVVPGADPWKYWVFNIGVNGNFSSDEVYKSSSASLELSAQKITDKIKTGFEVDGDEYKTVFNIDTGNGNFQKIRIKNNNYKGEHYLVTSLGQHWSFGYEVSYSRNTFSNNKNRLILEAGVEYALFPYKEANTKFFGLRYMVHARNNRYIDTTLYDKTRETLFGHGMEAKLSFNQKWGTISFGADYQNYLHNWKFYKLGADLSIFLRITGALSFYINASAELTHDQLYLPKGGATPQEIFTRLRQLASAYNLSTNLGLNYRFGSRLNNFVNPRFD